MWVLVDRGANVNVGVLPGAGRYARPGSMVPVNASINGQGKSQATTCSAKYALPIIFEDGTPLELGEVYDSPGSRKFLLDENRLATDHGIEVRTLEQCLLFPDGHRVPLHTRGDHRFS